MLYNDGMNNIFERLRRNFIYILFFLGTLVVLIVKFPEMWLSIEPLPGWDTLGHYYAFLKQIDFLKSGSLKGYMLEWFGGQPLFYFYSPLFFWLGSLIAIALPFLSPVVVFKWLILLSLAASAPIFYYFARTFLPLRPQPLVAWALFLLYIFFQPFEFGALGIGLPAVTEQGLISQGAGIALVLLFLSFYKRLLDGPREFWKEKYFYFAVTAGSVLLYSHMLSTVHAIILGVIVYLFYFKKPGSFFKSAAIFIGIALIGSYFLLPFQKYSQYTSLWNFRRTEGFFVSPMQPLLAFDLLDLLNGRWAVFNWPWLMMLIGAASGAVSLLRKKLFLLPALFLLPFLIIPTDYFPQMLPSLSLQFHRIMPLMIILCLVMSLYGYSLLDDWLKADKRYLFWRMVFWTIFLGMVVWRISIFSFVADSHNVKPNLLKSTVNPITYHFSLVDYPGSRDVENLLDCLRGEDVSGRVGVEQDLTLLLQRVGSSHYFDYALPQAGFAALYGLYSESANQAAFVYPPFVAISPIISEYNYPSFHYLTWNNIFRGQTSLDSVKQLGLFNVQYIVAHDPGASYNMASLGAGVAQAVNCPGTSFSLYRVNDALRRPYVGYPSYKPFLYVMADNEYLSFRKLSLGWFTLTELSDVPVIYKKGLRLDRLETIPEGEWGEIAGIIVGAESLSREDAAALKGQDKPVLVLSDGLYRGESLPPEFVSISHFKPVADFDEYNQHYFPDPVSLKKFREFIIGTARTDKNKIDPKSELSVWAWKDQEIAFTGTGPVLINASYFPAWRSLDQQQTIYEVTPGQMLVFSKGDTRLKFSATRYDWIGGFISLVSILGLFGAVYLLKKTHS